MDLHFSTARLNIFKTIEEEIPSIMEMEEDIQNRDFVWQGSYNQHLSEINSKEELLLSIKTKDNKLIGFALIGLDFKSDVFELRRIVISPKGKGYGKEFMYGVMKYCFENLNMNRFWLDVYPDNIIGIKLYESIGLVYEGSLRQSYKSDKGYKNQMVYSMLKDEYFNKDIK